VDDGFSDRKRRSCSPVDGSVAPGAAPESAESASHVTDTELAATVLSNAPLPPALEVVHEWFL